MSKKVIVGLLAAMLLCQPVYAEDYINCGIASDGTVTVEETTAQADVGNVSIVVYYPGKSFEDLATLDENQVIALCDQVKPNENGSYTFEFKLDGESGFYNAEITFDNSKETQKVSFLYSDPKEASAQLAILNKAASADEFYNLIYGSDEGWKKLGFFAAGIDEVDKRKVSDILYAHVRTEKFDETDPGKAMQLFMEAYISERLNENKDVSLADIEKYFSGADLMKYYEMEYMTDSAKQEIVSALKGKSFTSIQSALDAFSEQIAMKTVKYADGFGRIKDVLTDGGKIETSSYSNAEYQKALGNSYSDYADLKKALDGFKNKSSGSGSGSGSSGSGSGKKNNSVIGSGGVKVDNSVIKNPEAEPLKNLYFDDIDNYEWARKAIEELAQKGVVSGKEKRQFCPADNILREEFTAMVVKAFNLQSGTEDVSFTDVEEDGWYKASVKAAVNSGLIFGKDDGSFGVGEKITRQDMAVIIARALQLEETGNVEFADDAQISEYAKNAVHAMKNAGIISGFEDNTFRPFELATRAEAAVMIANASSK